jgi:hypothetical protein
MILINGKEYTEFDINLRCAVLMGIEYELNDIYVMTIDEVASIETGTDEFMEYCPCHSPADADSIIDKCWDELIFADYRRNVTWEMLMEKHNCTKLVAACICYIEINEAAL